MAATTDCIFCRIVAGAIPANTVLDTAHALAFMDIAPLAEGHTLLIPKRHRTTLADMSSDELSLISRELPRLGEAILSATGAHGYNVLQNNGEVAGQVVQHVHFHIIPRHADDGLGYRWNTKSYAEDRAQALQKSIRNALAKRG